MRRISGRIATVMAAVLLVSCAVVFGAAATCSASEPSDSASTPSAAAMASVLQQPFALDFGAAVGASRVAALAPIVDAEAMMAPAAAAQRFPLGANQEPAWQFGIAPYLWFAALDGDIGAGALEGDMSTDFSDAVKDLDFGYGIRLEAKNGAWSVLLDLAQLDLDDKDSLKGSRVDLDAEILVGDLNFLLEIIQQERYSFEILAGGRYSDVDNDIKVRGGASSSSSEEWFDPTIGARIRANLGEGADASVRADYGGFDLGGDDKDTSWQIVAELLFKSGSYDLGFGYRHLVQEFEQGTGNDAFSWDQEIVGPTVMLNIRF